MLDEPCDGTATRALLTEPSAASSGAFGSPARYGAALTLLVLLTVGDSVLVVLLFDVWHPELTADEIAAIQAMFEEVERRRAAREAEGAS